MTIQLSDLVPGQRVTGMASRYDDVPGFGTVNVRDAVIKYMAKTRLSVARFESALYSPQLKDRKETTGKIRRWGHGIRIVIEPGTAETRGIATVALVKPFESRADGSKIEHRGSLEAAAAPPSGLPRDFSDNLSDNSSHRVTHSETSLARSSFDNSAR